MLATHSFAYGGEVLKSSEQFGHWIATVETKFGPLMARKLVLDLVHRAALRIWPQVQAELEHPAKAKAQSKPYLRLAWGLISGHIAKDNELALNSFRAASETLVKESGSKLISAIGSFASAVEADDIQHSAPAVVDQLFKAYRSTSADPMAMDFWMAISADAQFVLGIDPHGPVIWPRLWPKDVNSAASTHWRNFKKLIAATGDEAVIRSWHFFVTYYDHLIAGQPQNMSPLTKLCYDDHIDTWTSAIKESSLGRVAATLTAFKSQPMAAATTSQVKTVQSSLKAKAAQRRSDALSYLNSFAPDIARVSTDYLAHLKMVLTERKVNPPRFKTDVHLKTYQQETQLLISTYKTLAEFTKLTVNRTGFEDGDCAQALKLYDAQKVAIDNFIAARPNEKHRGMLCLAVQGATNSIGAYLGQSIGD